MPDDFSAEESIIFALASKTAAGAEVVRDTDDPAGREAKLATECVS